MPKVSILIPIYNREMFVAECIQSALSQTFFDIEVVVVDNASTDNTWKICETFAKKDKRVRIFQNSDNIGPVRNWQRCVAEARGEYVKFLFSDDLLLPKYLERTVPLMSDPDVAFVSAAALIGSSFESSVLSYVLPRSSERLSSADYFQILASGRYPLPYSPCAAIFRLTDVRSNLLVSVATSCEHDFSVNGAGPDVLLFALTAMQYGFVVLLNEPLVFFRHHRESFTIMNDMDLVARGYRLSLAWFFQNHLNSIYFNEWLAGIWVYYFISKREIISMSNLCKFYGGNCGIKEYFFISYKIILRILNIFKIKLFKL